MKKGKYLFFILLSTCFCYGVLASNYVNATETPANAIMQVSPVIEEFSLEPATKTDKSVSVTNQGDQELKIRIYTTPYSISADNDASDFASQSEYTQIYHWIKIQNKDQLYQDEAEYVINPHDTININYRIDVPESAPSGSQHACIFVETIPDEAESQNGITTISRAAIKIFANVSGETINDAEIISLDTNTFVLSDKVPAKTMVKNIGNVDIRPTLSLKINSLSGETVFNETSVAVIFPEDSGEINVEWPETPAFGIYNLVASVNILGKNSTIEKTIFVFPVWFLILIILLVTACFVILTAFIRKRRKNRKLTEV